MWETSGDVLNMSLAIGFIVLVIFICFLIFYAVLVMRDVSRVSEDISKLVRRVDRTVEAPLRLADSVIEKAAPYVEAVIERIFKR